MAMLRFASIFANNLSRRATRHGNIVEVSLVLKGNPRCRIKNVTMAHSDGEGYLGDHQNG